MTTYPAARWLVPPDPPALAEDFTVLRSPLTNGFPHFIDLTKTLRLKVTLPTGLMQPWLHADPAALVSTSEDERQPRSAAVTDQPAAASNPSLRLAISQGGAVLFTTPATLGNERHLPDAGDAVQGVRVAIELLGWSIFAGTLQGPGDFGSFVQFGWKAASEAVSDFGPPVINPFLVRRLAPRLKVRSELGLLKPVVDRRFAVRRLALDVRF
jgi:hypothetical protein